MQEEKMPVCLQEKYPNKQTSKKFKYLENDLTDDVSTEKEEKFLRKKEEWA